MTGDANNVTPWADADVYVGSLLSTNPTAGAAFTLTGSNPWSLEGLLDGAAGFGESQSWEDTPYSAWGAGEIGATKRNLAISRMFTAMEVDGKAALAQRYDTTGLTYSGAGFTGDLGARVLQSKFKVAFEMRSNGIIDRRICKNYAQITALGDIVYGENAPPTMLVTLKIYPDITSGKPIYWSAYRGAAS